MGSDRGGIQGRRGNEGQKGGRGKGGDRGRLWMVFSDTLIASP